jgi:hypothetical protein
MHQPFVLYPEEEPMSTDWFAQFSVSRLTGRLPRRVGMFAVLIIATLIIAGCPSKQIGFQGTLRDPSGNPINGTHSFKFRLWTCSSGTGSGCVMEYEQGPQDVAVTNGLFDVPIGVDTFDANEGPNPAIFTRQLFLEIEIDGEVLSPRQPLHGAPYAFTLVGGSVIISTHAGPGGTDGTDENYATLSVVAAGGKGTSLAVQAATNGGDLIRACTGALGGTNTRECDNLRFRVQNNGTVTADGAFTGGGADFAEYISGVGKRSQYEPGDVMVISATHDRAVELAAEPYSSAVIGVYSTDPALLGGGRYLDDQGNTDMLPIGIVGIVPVKVSAENGAIHRGDLLTTSGTPGHAMLATEFVPGAILGKAMGELAAGTGVIEVVLLLQ